MYFAIYQSLAVSQTPANETTSAQGKVLQPSFRFHEYPSDFFDLVIVDECHRGSARDESSWRAILDHFEPAVKLGMTATPLQDDTRDTYDYFGKPLYQYNLRQGIEDGYVAPYRVHCVITDWDAAGWRPSKDELDRYGRPIPDDEYQTRDFEKVVALRARTQAIAKHLTTCLKKTDRFAKTIVFCVDQEHASEMRTALNNFNSDVVADHPDYVARVTADEGDIGRGHLGRFQDVDSNEPIILTTSQLLTTGVDVPTCKNIVLARVVGSMSEFKQIIGRGTRVRDDYGKLWFNILDYSGSATRLFADPAFDGDPIRETVETIDEAGKTTGQETVVPEPPESETTTAHDGDGVVIDSPVSERKKYYFDGGQVEIAAHLVYELDPDGKQLRVIRYTDYAAERIRTLFPTAPELRAQWSDPTKRSEIIQRLEARGICFADLAESAKQPEADPFDLLCHLAFNAPLRTRRERAQMFRDNRKDFFAQYGPEARQILEELLDKYAEHGAAQFALPDVLKVPPVSTHGQIGDITKLFGGADKLRTAVTQLQSLLYAA